MIIEYENTIEDYREMSSAVAKTDIRIRKRKVNIPAIIFGVTIGIIWVIFSHLHANSDNFDLVIPWLTIIILMVVLRLQLWIMAANGSPSKALRSFIGLVIMAAIAMILWAWLKLQDPNLAGHAQWQLLAPHLGWFILFSVLGYFLVLSRTSGIRKMWESQPNLQQKNTVDISVDGITVSTASTRSEYQWPAFTRWEETKNLFIVSLGRFHIMLPKLAFHSDEELNAFRAMARVITGNKPIGFPVPSIPAPS